MSVLCAPFIGVLNSDLNSMDRLSLHQLSAEVYRESFLLHIKETIWQESSHADSIPLLDFIVECKMSIPYQDAVSVGRLY
jgi:hypothetical protein